MSSSWPPPPPPPEEPAAAPSKSQVSAGTSLGGEKPPPPPVAPPPATVAAAPGAVARAEELDRVGDDLDRLAFAAAVFGLPLAPVEPAFDRYRSALGEVVGAVLALAAEDDDVEVVGLVDPLAELLRRG